ncbi:uncharacterized protein LOC125179496 [Hyalella azteca]|uniref:Uncharacterized protein LOC125179496 n=1 Tax=Hyalella azteca TaxID=294128 RepID=A0A979FXY2_HYAAZ|nr:uncharacterized protein LOC125179496 [Hyalella azteca]
MHAELGLRHAVIVAPLHHVSASIDDGPLMPSLTELQGVPLKIAIAQGQREVGLVTSSPKQDRLGGYLGSLIHLIADSANFSPRVVQDKSVGKRLDNGSFTGVIGRLQRREVDIGLASFTVLLRRVPAMDFTAYLRRKTTRFITKVPAYKRDPFILINVFKIETWLTMIFFTGFGFVMLAILLGPCGESEFSTEAETTYGMEYKNINRGKEIIDLPLIEGDRSAILYANEKIIGENERDFQADCQKDYGFRDELGENVQTGENFRDNEEMIYNGLPNTHRQKEERNDSYHLSQKAKILAIFRKVTHYFNWEKAGVLLKTITLQKTGNWPLRRPARVLLLFTSFLGMLLTASYAGSLVAYLSVPRMEPVPETLHQLKRMDYTIILNAASNEIENIFVSLITINLSSLDKSPFDPF